MYVQVHTKENTPMTLSESAINEILAALDNGNGADLVRQLAELGMQDLIEAEATEVIGAQRWERTIARIAHRNGHRPRVLSTMAGDLELRIPKFDRGSFLPSVLEPRRRIDQAMYAVVMEAYVNGISTRSVDNLVAALGVDTGISKSEVSRICAGLDERVAAFRNRTLGHTAFPYVYLDATYVHVRDDALGQIVSRAVVIATGITAQGGREILGVDIGDSEDTTFWTAFLRSLKRRGLGGVRLVISDAHEGLKAAIRTCFQGASWQRCRVHYAEDRIMPIQEGGGGVAPGQSAAGQRLIGIIGTARVGSVERSCSVAGMLPQSWNRVDLLVRPHPTCRLAHRSVSRRPAGQGADSGLCRLQQSDPWPHQGLPWPTRHNPLVGIMDLMPNSA